MNTNSLTPEEMAKEIEKIKNENLSQYPSIFQMGRDLVKQGWMSAVSMSRGHPLMTSPATASARLEICEACEFFKAEEGRCLKCGCYMRAKVHLESAACPMSYWNQFQSIPAQPRVFPPGGTPLLERNVVLPRLPEDPVAKDILIKNKYRSKDDIDLFMRGYNKAAASGSIDKTFKVKNITYTIIDPPPRRSNVSGSLSASGSQSATGSGV